MTTDDGDVLLVGSIARLDDDWTVEDVFRRAAPAALGDHVTMLPGRQARRPLAVDHLHRAQRVLRPSRPRDALAPHLRRLAPQGLRRPVALRRPRGRGRDPLRSASATPRRRRRSYEIFKRLRDEGAIPDGMRFLVAYPLHRERGPRIRQRAPATTRSSGARTTTRCGASSSTWGKP